MKPVWEQIRDTLSAELAANRYPIGARLPSESALSARFGVNRHTVRRALGALQDAGVLHARRGSGVFVTGTHLSYHLGRRTQFGRNLLAAGRTGARTILRTETVPAGPDEAKALAIGPGARIHVFDCVGSADGVPISYAHSIFPAERFPDLLDDLRRTQSVTAAFRAGGLSDYRRKETRLTAERAAAQVARHLKVSEGSPILRTIGLNVDPDGRPIERGMTWFAADRVELVVDEDGFAQPD